MSPIQFLLFLFLFFPHFYIYAKPHLIKICDQNGFDNVEEQIKASVDRGINSILISFNPGTYYYNESHLKLKNLSKNLSIVFDGNGSRLIGNLSSIKGIHNPSIAYFIDNTIMHPWSDVVQTDELIEVIDKGEKLCRIKKVDNIEVRKGDYIQISQWYLAPRYEIIDVKNGYIYFVAKNLAEGYKKADWNINNDFNYGLIYPRYRVFHIYSSHEDCQKTTIKTFLNLKNLIINQIELREFKFYGDAYSQDGGMIQLDGLRANQIIIDDCTFEECQSRCVNIVNTDNVIVRNCSFIENSYQCIEVDQTSKNTNIINNHFQKNGKGWSNKENVICRGDNFVIAGNIFVDFCYGAIGIGVQWASEKNKNRRVCGIVEQNEIYYTSFFFDNYKMNTLMDSGAIYTWTQNDDVIIRFNYIHDIIGMKDNRGIFCDDGTCNVCIYGNIITNTPNSYSIDLRACPNIEKDPRFTFGKVNVGNKIFGNLIDGDLRFEGRKDDMFNGCNKGTNYLLQQGNNTPVIRIYDIYSSERDITVKGKSTGNYIIMEEEGLKLIKKNPYLKNSKKIFKKVTS